MTQKNDQFDKLMMIAALGFASGCALKEFEPDAHTMARYLSDPEVKRRAVELGRQLARLAAEQAGASQNDLARVTAAPASRRQCNGGPNDRDKLGWCGKPATHVAGDESGAEWFCCEKHHEDAGQRPNTRLVPIAEWFAALGGQPCEKPVAPDPMVKELSDVVIAWLQNQFTLGRVPQLGFTLLLFEPGKPGQVPYISTASRDQTRHLLRQVLRNLKDEPRTH